jgi:hypothetical protein
MLVLLMLSGAAHVKPGVAKSARVVLRAISLCRHLMLQSSHFVALDCA